MQPSFRKPYAGIIPAVGSPDGRPALGPTAMKVVPIRQELPRPVLQGLVERDRLTRYATPAEFKVGKKTVAYSPDQRARKAERARERYQEKKRALAEAGGAGETKSPSLRSSARVGWGIDPQR